ncbi:hypothetical protein Syun_027478 [Stephania yunnanensis]|uniref:Uncharacterized protein n=1 Tax=Stephania yunnanensis TaxID=152371 RepID=A0AAP0EKS1_9MAGN
MYWNRIKRGWDCDSKVHRINFLVARHTSSLLCLRATTGVKLGPKAVSVCERCMKGNERGGGVADEETSVSEESESSALWRDGAACEQRSMQRKERGGGVAENDDDESGDEIDRDDDATVVAIVMATMMRGAVKGLGGGGLRREGTRSMSFAF